MRLIDADALKELFPDNGEGLWTYNITAKMYIDNAPTVTPDKIQAIMSDYLVYRSEPQRPTGKWIETEEPCGWSDLTCCECSICKHSWALGDLSIEDVKEDFKFCPNCGARMTQGETEG